VKDKIEVAYDTEFQEILERLGLREQLESGGMYCGFCHEQLNANNVLGVYSDNGQILLCCDKPECGSRLAEKTATVG
jgi:hypothetical protein